MKLACNIDSAGKAVRFRLGLSLVAVALVVGLAWALPSRSAFAWVLSGLLGAGGAFTLFEARSGWCAVRAMGFKTRL
jgi:hypothetical protein